MKFSIIVPTHKRVDSLIRAVNSVLSQTYTDWELIIVNDSPFDTSYETFTSSINDSRIRYHLNDTNRGVNFSRNSALDMLSADSKWVIFLDDDDYFAPDTLQVFHDLILLHNNQKWFVSNRSRKNGTSMTLFPADDTYYTYAWNYLILKRCKGDATHCIESKLITQKKIRFSKHVKQGEEWFFFYQLGLYSNMFYTNHNSTISDGYEEVHGLNFRKRGTAEQLENIMLLFYEGSAIQLIRNPSFSVYLILRIIRACITFRFKN